MAASGLCSPRPLLGPSLGGTFCVYADKGEETLQPALSGACVNEPSLCFRESEFETVLQDSQTNFQKETGPRPCMGLLCLWYPGSSVFHAGLFGGSCVMLLMTRSVKPALE